MKKGYVQSGCYTLYYEIHGEGEPVITLHGGPGFSHEGLKPLEALSDDFKVVFFDQRGTGDSDKADTRSYTIDANVEDIEQIRRYLNIGHCDIFGHSWGGMLAQAGIDMHDPVFWQGGFDVLDRLVGQLEALPVA